MTQEAEQTQGAEQAPQITRIIVREGFLYAVNRAKQELPIYVFGPLVDYPEGLNVPIVDKYEQTLREFVVKYFPVPALDMERYPQESEAPSGFWPRKRDDKEDSRPWDQAVYGGFPLYIHGNGTTNEPPREMNRPLFRPASIQLRGGPVKRSPPLIPPGYGP